MNNAIKIINERFLREYINYATYLQYNQLSLSFQSSNILKVLANLAREIDSEESTKYQWNNF